MGGTIYDALTHLSVLFHRLQIQHFLGGSAASSLRGSPRMTNDIDLVADIRPDQVAEFVRGLEPAFYVSAEAVHEAIARKSAFNIIHLDTVLKIDIFVFDGSPWAQAELARASYEPIGPDPSAPSIPVAGAEDLIIQKLYWFQLGGEVSDRQWQDVLGMLRAQAGLLDMDYVRHWCGQRGVAPLLERALAQSTG